MSTKKPEQNCAKAKDVDKTVQKNVHMCVVLSFRAMCFFIRLENYLLSVCTILIAIWSLNYYCWIDSFWDTLTVYSTVSSLIVY
jgi:hypothetical protein